MLGDVSEEFSDQKGLVLREVPVIKYQQELAILQRLNRMGKPGPKVPQVASTDVVNEVARASQRDGLSGDVEAWAHEDDHPDPSIGTNRA